MDPQSMKANKLKKWRDENEEILNGVVAAREYFERQIVVIDELQKHIIPLSDVLASQNSQGVPNLNCHDLETTVLLASKPSSQFSNEVSGSSKSKMLVMTGSMKKKDATASSSGPKLPEKESDTSNSKVYDELDSSQLNVVSALPDNPQDLQEDLPIGRYRVRKCTKRKLFHDVVSSKKK